MTPRCRSPSSAPVGAGVRMGRRWGVVLAAPARLGSPPPSGFDRAARPGGERRGERVSWGALPVSPGRRGRASPHDLPHEGWEAGRPVVPARRRPDLRCAGGGVAHLGRAGSTATGPPVHGRGVARVRPRACSRRWIPVRGRVCGRFRSGVSHPSTPVDNPGDRRWTSRVRGVDHSDPAGDTRGRLLVLSTGTASSPQNYTSVSPHPQPPG